MVLYYAGKYTVHHQIAPESLGEVTLAGRFDTIFLEEIHPGNNPGNWLYVNVSNVTAHGFLVSVRMLGFVFVFAG